MDFITGEKFETVGKHVFAPVKRLGDDYGHLINTVNLHSLQNGDIIYTHTFYVKQLFEVLRFMSGRLTIVTHNADTRVDDTFHIPECVEKWYAQNVEVSNPIIESIPIGLENDRWFKVLKKKEKMEAVLQTFKIRKNLVYMNHNVATNPEKRSILYETYSKKPWVTSEMGKNGQYFDEYLDNVYNHAFVICPEGNGIDTHRTWETLYMQSIPIEKRNINNQFYKDLPICFVDDWEELTEEFLLRELQRIQMTEWNPKKLTFEYWKNKIKNEK